MSDLKDELRRRLEQKISLQNQVKKNGLSFVAACKELQTEILDFVAGTAAQAVVAGFANFNFFEDRLQMQNLEVKFGNLVFGIYPEVHPNPSEPLASTFLLRIAASRLPPPLMGRILVFDPESRKFLIPKGVTLGPDGNPLQVGDTFDSDDFKKAIIFAIG